MQLLTAGTHLGRFVLINVLGKGGMGEVWRAQDPRLGREVAVKVLPPELEADPDSRIRFERESKILAALNHPNIAHIYEAGDEVPIGPGAIPGKEKVSFLVMELIEGKSLSDILLSGQLAALHCVRLSRQIARALGVAHRAGIVHRDLKPANIMVTQKNQVKVLDFGLARPTATAGGPNLPEVTVPGMVMGTAAYLSPEQVKGHPADTRSDIWALGCVMYQMLAGKRPFPSHSIPEILAGILRDDPEDVKSFSSSIPEELSLLVKRCLEKEPEDRPQSAMEVSQSLKQILLEMKLSRKEEEIEVSESQQNVPSSVHIDAMNRYLKSIHFDYPQLSQKKSGPVFAEVVHQGVKIGVLVGSRGKDKNDLAVFVSPVFHLPEGRREEFYRKLLILSNGHTDVAQFAVDPLSGFVNLVCVRVCSFLDQREFRYVLDTMSRLSQTIVLAIKREFALP